jgi:fructooligosaccharide transport system substrate-binding protein
MADLSPRRQLTGRLNRRWFLESFAGSLAVTAALVACSSQPAAPTAAPTTAAQPAASTPTAAPAAAAAAASGEAITLTWDTFRGSGTTWPQMMVDSYQKLYPNRKINYRPIPVPNAQAEAYPKMYAMYAAGTLGDNFAFDPSHWEFYRAVPQGLLRPIDDLVAQDKLDFSPWFGAFIEMQHYKGKMWGLPSWGWTGVDGLHFNQVALDAAGLTVPDYTSSDWTMDKVREYANKLHKKTGDQVDRYGINLGFNAAGATILARAFNSDILSADGTKMLLSDPKTRPAMQWISDICTKDKVDSLPGSYQGSDAQLFASGKLAIDMGGSLTVFQIDKAIKDPSLAKMKSVLFPKRTDGKRPCQLRGGTWNINSKSPHPAEAWQFVKQLSSHDGILTMNTVGGEGALVRPDVLEDKYFTANPNFLIFKENLANAILAIVPANARGTEYETTFAQSFAELYLGKSDFDTAVKHVQDAVQAILDKPAT